MVLQEGWSRGSGHFGMVHKGLGRIVAEQVKHSMFAQGVAQKVIEEG